SYDAKSDRYIDISVYDAKDPIAEIFRLYDLQKIHFERSDPRDVIGIAGPDAVYLQKLLAKKGFFKGESDGAWDEASTKALADYMGWENYDVRIRQDGKIDRKILDLIKAKEGAMSD
ncbi:MAG TPA: putative peptidoglycan binding domain-containing protein, partial [Thermoanaerobaculia bacterium]